MEQLDFDDAMELSGMSLAEIAKDLEQRTQVGPALLARLEEDPRRGTTELAERYRQRQEERQQARERLQELKAYEKTLHEKGYVHIAGVDEVGRGALAGPVMAAAVILPQESAIMGVDDSKAVPAYRREELHDRILSEAVAWGLGAVSAAGIDRMGIAAATGVAMARALSALELRPEYVLIDGGIRIPGLVPPFENIPQGDTRHYAVAAASIVAKVERDQRMVELARDYPPYGFETHKGYGTTKHLKAVETYGYSAAHRRSFRFHDKDQLTLEI